MRSLVSRTAIVLFCTAFMLSIPGVLSAAQDHVVSPAELHRSAVNASRTRRQNIATIDRFLELQPSRKALKSAHLDPVQVRSAVPLLSNQELARLAARADTAQQNFVAGDLSGGEITLIFVVLIIAVVVLLTR